MDYSGKTVFKDINLRNSTDIMSMFDVFQDKTGDMVSDMQKFEGNSSKKKSNKPISKKANQKYVPYAERYEQNLIQEIDDLLKGNANENAVGMCGFPIFDFAKFKPSSKADKSSKELPVDKKYFDDDLSSVYSENSNISESVRGGLRSRSKSNKGSKKFNFNKGNFERNNKFVNASKMVIGNKSKYGQGSFNYNKKYNNKFVFNSKFKNS